MRYGFALSVVLATQTATDAFQIPALFNGANRVAGLSTKQQRAAFHQVAASSIYASGDGRSGNATASSLYLASLVSDAVQSDDDIEEIELAKRRRKITERAGSFRVKLPLGKSSDAPPMGMTIRQFALGPEISDQILDLDSLAIETVAEADDVTSQSENMETIATSTMKERLDPNFAGLYVASVAVDSAAWNAGVRPGDMLTSGAATFGEALWPKTLGTETDNPRDTLV